MDQLPQALLAGVVAVSLPRQVLRGALSFISRRCTERRFLFRPDAYVTRVFLFCLAYTAAECGILVHGFVVLSNHFHLLLTDPDGCLPVFMERLDGLLARALNAYRGRWESFFAPGSYSAVRLETPEDFLSKLTYLLTNPVAAGLVDHSRRWTGATSVRWPFGETRTVTRPDGQFFGPDSSLPATAALTLMPPEFFDDLPDDKLDDLMRERVIARETEFRAAHRSQGLPFRGMDEVLRLDPEDRPGSREPRRRRNPRVAGSDTDVRIAAITGWMAFVQAYRKAWLKWQAGNRRAVFPEGTWLMRIRYGASCQPPSPS